MARHSLGHRRLRESGNGTSTPQVLTRPKRSYRHVGLRPSTALACSVIAIVQVAALLPAHAQTIWTGNTSSNWFTGGNWQGGAAPTLATNAFLDTIVPNPTVVNGPGAQALDLVVGASFTGALTIGSGGTVANTDGSLGFSAGSTGTVTVGGTWTRWGYVFSPVDGGTEVTESWEFLPAGMAMFEERFGADAQAQVANRAEAARTGIPVTLAALKRTAEGQ